MLFSLFTVLHCLYSEAGNRFLICSNIWLFRERCNFFFRACGHRNRIVNQNLSHKLKLC